MKKLLALLLAMLAISVTMVACNDDDDDSSESSSNEPSTSETPSNPSAESTEDSSKTEIKDKYPAVPKIEYNVNINQTVNAGVFNDLSKFGNEDKALAYANAKEKEIGVDLEITEPGEYHYTGTTTKGYIKIDIPRNEDDEEYEKVTLILDNVDITSSNEAESLPPIYSTGCDLTIVLPKGTTSKIKDTSTNIERSAICVKSGNLTITGEGTLRVEGVNKSAISCKKAIYINGGIFDLTAEYHGIYAEAGLKYGVEDKPENHIGVVINSGDFKIKAGKSAIKSGDYEEAIKNEAGEVTTPEKNEIGNIVIENGKFDLETNGNAIFSNGKITINGGGYNIVSAEDGLNATDAILLAGTDVETVMIIDAKEDGINSDVSVTMNGKTNVKISSVNDGVDSMDIEINIDGVLYIKTSAIFEEDMYGGDYILDNKEYYKVDRDLYDGKAFFSISGSSKGLTAVNSITIKAGQIGIDADEDAIASTDGKIKDSATENKIVIEGGVISLDSRESAIKADNLLTISGESTKISVIKSDKGLNSESVTINNGTIVIVAISDGIDATTTEINNGNVYLFDKVDMPKEGGSFTVNGGTVVCLSTTKNPKLPTSSTNKIVAKAIETPTDYVFGNDINIKGGAIDITLKLPKSYAEKLSVMVISPSVTAGEYVISVGNYSDGIISSLVWSGGVFTKKSSEAIGIQ